MVTIGITGGYGKTIKKSFQPVDSLACAGSRRTMSCKDTLAVKRKMGFCQRWGFAQMINVSSAVHGSVHIISSRLLSLVFHGQQQVGRSGMCTWKENRVGMENAFLTFRDMRRKRCLPGSEKD